MNSHRLPKCSACTPCRRADLSTLAVPPVRYATVFVEVTPDRDAAGVGKPGPEGWSWSTADDLAEKIAQAIAILANEDVPAFVPLPVQVQ